MIRMRKALTPRKIVCEDNPEDSIKKERKPIRWKSGTVAMRDIRHLQNRCMGLGFGVHIQKLIVLQVSWTPYS
jgi:hypothetical protein